MNDGIERMLRALAREDVTEGALATGRFPSVRMADGFRGVSQEALSSDDILGALMLLGGGAHVDELSQIPVSWAHRRTGLGMLRISATMKGDEVRVRFQLAKDAPLSPGAQGAAAPATHAQPAKSKSIRPRKPSGQMKAPSIAPPAKGSSRALAHKKGESRPNLAAMLGAATVGATGATGAASGPDPYAAVMRGLGEIKLPDGAPAIELDLDRAPPPPSSRQAKPQRRHGGDPLLSLFEEARERGASDLHVIADRPALFRVGGELAPDGPTLARDKVDAMLRGCIPARLAARFEHEGSVDFALDLDDLGRVRANVGRQRTGLKGCFRLIHRETPTLESHGLPLEIAKATHQHQGLIVVTGPTGHGKTTTLAAIVDVINRDLSHHVITVEDPVEYVHARKKAVMSQREVGTHTKTFHSALKGALREDPDVIVVGELRDLETVEMALEASETGHLVIGTMNTPSAAKTVDRLIDMFPPGDQQQVRMTLAGGLKLIVGQRLVPSVDRKKLHAAVEVLPGSVPLWNLIREQKTYQLPSLQQRGKALGILRLDDGLSDLVKSGKVSLDDALVFAEAPELFAQAHGGRPGQPRAGGPAPASQADTAAGQPTAAKGLFDRAGALFGKK
jgi:twitching motility protein PilT